MHIKSVWRNNFSGPGTIMLKVNFLCINSTRKPLLIHGFSPVNSRLLTVYDTVFYAITVNNCFIFFIVSIQSYDQMHYGYTLSKNGQQGSI